MQARKLRQAGTSRRERIAAAKLSELAAEAQAGWDATTLERRVAKDLTRYYHAIDNETRSAPAAAESPPTAPAAPSPYSNTSWIRPLPPTERPTPSVLLSHPPHVPVPSGPKHVRTGSLPCLGDHLRTAFDCRHSATCLSPSPRPGSLRRRRDLRCATRERCIRPSRRPCEASQPPPCDPSPRNRRPLASTTNTFFCRATPLSGQFQQFSLFTLSPILLFLVA